VSEIKKKEGTGIKRVNVNIPTELHNSFKAATAAQGLEMTIVLLEFSCSTRSATQNQIQSKLRRNLVLKNPFVYPLSTSP
jgi:ParG